MFIENPQYAADVAAVRQIYIDSIAAGESEIEHIIREAIVEFSVSPSHAALIAAKTSVNLGRTTLPGIIENHKKLLYDYFTNEDSDPVPVLETFVWMEVVFEKLLPDINIYKTAINGCRVTSEIESNEFYLLLEETASIEENLSNIRAITTKNAGYFLIVVNGRNGYLPTLFGQS